MKIKPLAVLAAVAALGVPATAVAAKPADKPAKPGHAHVHKAKNAVFKGAVVSFDATTVTVHVAKVNHWSKAFKDTDVVFDVSKLKKAVTVATGDAVLVQARITKDDAQPFVARKLNKLHAEDTPEAPEAPETDD